MLNKTALLLTGLTLSLSVLTACQTTAMSQNGNNPSVQYPQSDLTPERLAAYDWHLVNSIDANERPIEVLNTLENPAELRFATQNGDNTISFGVGCNAMAATYTLDKGVLEVGTIKTTLMLCGDLDKAERTLADVMNGNSQVRYQQANPPMLTQIAANGSTLTWQGKKKLN